MIALDQMPGAKMQAAQVLPLLDAEDETVRSAALWIADHQPDWGDQIVPYLQTKLAEQERTEGQADVLVRFMTQYASNTNVQQTMAGVLVDGESTEEFRELGAFRDGGDSAKRDASELVLFGRGSRPISRTTP